jgi:hypothetical protein
VPEFNDTDRPKTLSEITVFCAKALGASGAAITLSTTQNSSGDVAGSDQLCIDLQHEQALLGEGPAGDARATNTIVIVTDFAIDPERWPIFGPVALRAGMRSAVALPLTAGVIQLGALVFYNAQTTSYNQAFLAEAATVAGVATSLLLGGPNHKALTMDTDSDGGSAIISVVHQATGMVAAQLDCGIEEALVRLRAHAFATSQSLIDASKSIVQRKFRFE